MAYAVRESRSARGGEGPPARPGFHVNWDVLGPYQEPGWQRRLDELFPPGARVQSLHLYWEPGYRWQKVERWMIGVVTPSEFVPEFMRDFFSGPDPAKLGHWELYRGEPHWVSDPECPPISRRQWRYFRDTGNLLEPYWVIQGEHGGHKYKFTRQEEVLSQMADGPAAPPVPGTLPYATLDERTVSLLLLKDKIRTGLGTLAMVERDGVRLSLADAAEAEAMRKKIVAFLHNESREAAEAMASHATRAVWDGDQPVSNQYDLERDGEVLEDSYINRGV